MADKLKIPAFASEAEEAQWWYDHREEVAKAFEEAAARGRARSPPNLPQDAASRCSCSRREKAGELSSKTALYAGTSRKGNLRTLKGYHPGQPRRRRDWHPAGTSVLGKWSEVANFRVADQPSNIERATSPSRALCVRLTLRKVVQVVGKGVGQDF